MTIDFASSFYFHREGPGLLMGMSDPDEQPGFSLETTDDWIPALLEIASRRAPRIADAGIQGGWAGLYEMSPDHNAIIGEATPASRASSTPPASPATASCRDRRWARSSATWCSSARRSSTSRRSASSASMTRRSAPSSTSSSRMTSAATSGHLAVTPTDELRDRARAAMERCGAALTRPEAGPRQRPRGLADHRRGAVRGARRPPEDVDAAVARAAGAFRQWRTVPARRAGRWSSASASCCASTRPTSASWSRSRPARSSPRRWARSRR